jgi:hypothetical protein
MFSPSGSIGFDSVFHVTEARQGALGIQIDARPKGTIDYSGSVAHNYARDIGREATSL